MTIVIDTLLQVLVELPAPVVNDTKLTVEDFQQELKCSINIKHRFFFALSIDQASYDFHWYDFFKTLLVSLFILHSFKEI